MPYFKTSDDVEIHYRLWEQDSRQPLILLHHGFIADADVDWISPGIVQVLAETGRRVLALDARGHGRSGKPHDPARYGEARMAEDLRELMDLLDEEAYDLVGYSMGAVVSLLTAARDTRIRRLVIGGVGAAVVELGGVDSRVVGGPALVDALTAEDPSTVTDPSAADFRAFADAVGADRLALAAHARAIHQEPIPLTEITAPTLLLAGEDDPLATRPEVLAGALPAATLRTVPGDHSGAVGAPAFVTELAAFLDVP
ncbi:alpha/beta fold hydrolase [Streptomyces chilikensis]|uniref:Alpha/beta hydrolase n=1 Tax=Streptomyces chilikensis TaxID=1194079 RepID=A0ABV3ET89_9ACTN|nr:alpha/beta hydrolase [Streptomyces chilikensis]